MSHWGWFLSSHEPWATRSGSNQTITFRPERAPRRLPGAAHGESPRIGVPCSGVPPAVGKWIPSSIHPPVIDGHSRGQYTREILLLVLLVGPLHFDCGVSASARQLRRRQLTPVRGRLCASIQRRHWFWPSIQSPDQNCSTENGVRTSSPARARNASAAGPRNAHARGAVVRNLQGPLARPAQHGN